MESVVIQDFKFFIPAVVEKEKIWAHLDTGASQSSISTSLGKQLPRTEQKTLQAGLARREVTQHLLSHLEFFGESFRDVPAAAVDNRDYLSRRTLCGPSDPGRRSSSGQTPGAGLQTSLGGLCPQKAAERFAQGKGGL